MIKLTKNITSILILFVIMLGSSLYTISKIKKDAGQKIEHAKREPAEALARQEEQWVKELSRLEQEKKESLAKIKELRTEIELVRADYEERLSAEKYLWQEKLEKIKARETEYVNRGINDFSKQAALMMETGQYIEAVKNFSKILALVPDHKESIEGLRQAEDKINSEMDIDQVSRDLEKTVNRLKERGQRQIGILKEKLKEQTKLAEELEEQLQTEKKTRLELVKVSKSAEKKLAEELKIWKQENLELEKTIAGLDKDKQEYKQLEEETRRELEVVRKNYMETIEQVKKESEAKISLLEEKYSKTEEKLSQNLKSWEREKTQLDKTIAGLETDKQEYKRLEEKTKKELEALEEDYAETVDQLTQDADIKLSSVEDEHRKTEEILSQNLKSWKQEKAQLEKTIAALKKDTQEYKRLEENANKEMIAFEEDYVKKINKIKKDADIKLSSIQGKQQKAEEKLSEELAAWEQEKTQLEKVIVALDKDKQAYKEREEAAGQELAVLEKDYADNLKQIKKLNEEETFKQVDELSKRIQELINERAEWQKEKSDLEKRIAGLKLEHERKLKTTDEKSRARLNKGWQDKLAKLEQDAAEREEIWQDKFRTIEKTALTRIKEYEELAERKIESERKIWQERLDVSSSAVPDRPLLAKSPKASVPGSVEVSLQVLDQAWKAEASKLLDDAMNFIQKEDLVNAKSLLEQAVRLDPENNDIWELLARVRILLTLGSK